MFKVYFSVTYLMPWILLITAAILYRKSRRKSVLTILAGVLIVIAGQIVPVVDSIFRSGSGPETPVGQELPAYLYLIYILNSVGMLTALVGVIWFVWKMPRST